MAQAKDIIQPTKKKIYQLSLDEVKTEWVKLGLMSRDDNTNKSECLIKLMNFLLTRGFTSETFDFSPRGQTKFPEKLLIRNEIKSLPNTSSKFSRTLIHGVFSQCNLLSIPGQKNCLAN